MAGRKPKARYLQVRGWWDFQHYPDKVEAGWAPPWIKNYTALLTDYEYNALSELDRGRLHRVWLLAAKLDNKIPWDETYIRKAINASPSFRLKTFIDNEMLSEWTENATTRPPDKRRKPRNQAKKALDELLNGSSPEQSRAEEKREEANALADARFDEREFEVDKILKECWDVNDDSRGVLLFLARQVPLSQVVKVRQSAQRATKRIGVGWAANALKSEAKEAA